MLVRNYHYLLRNNPEQHSSQLLHGRKLKSICILVIQNQSEMLYMTKAAICFETHTQRIIECDHHVVFFIFNLVVCKVTSRL
jgi:hypothetical protein